MRKFFEVWIKPALCAAVLLALSACGSAGYGENPEMMSASAARMRGAEEVLAEDYQREAGSGESDASPETAFPVDARKLVREASLRLRVTDLEEAEKPVQAALRKYSGYAARSSIQESSRSYTLRVPSAAYETFLAELSPLGTVLYREESATDVTLRYYDLEGRLATKKTLLATFQSYLGKAKNIEEILSVEERIAGLQAEIDGIGSQLKNLADLVDYATIQLELYLPVTADTSWKPGLGERIAELFGDFGDFLKTALVVITGFILYGIPVLALLALAYWLLLGKVGLLRYLWRLVRKKAPGKT